MATNNPKMFYGEGHSPNDREASYLYALITGRRSVSRRNKASWFLRQLNKMVKCDPIEMIKQDDMPEKQMTNEKQQSKQNTSPLTLVSDKKDIFLVTAVGVGHDALEVATNDSNVSSGHKNAPQAPGENQRFLVTPNTRVLYLSKSIATSIILDLSPSVVSVSPQNDCVYLDSMFDALKKALHLLVKEHQFPSSQADRQFTLSPRVFVSVIAYTPFVVAKNNQVLIQNRRISPLNIEQVLVELWICLNKLIQELHELVTSTCNINFDYETNEPMTNAFVFTPPLNQSIIRHPGSVLDDIYELGLFSSSLMPRLSRLSIIIITDGLFASSNNLSAFRLRNIAVSFISLASESIYPDACFGYTTYNDLMKFVAKSTQGVYISHSDLIDLSYNLPKTKEIPLMSNPLYRLFSWTLHSDLGCDDYQSPTPKIEKHNSLSMPHPPDQMVEMKPEYIAKLFCIDQPVEAIQTLSSSGIDQSVDMELVSNQNYHDWRSFKQMGRNLDADFEQVLSCLLREGYLIKSIQIKHRETPNIVARLVLYWKHNLNLEQELQAPYWNSADPFELGDSNNLILKPFLAPSYGDTYCEVIVHGSYNFLHDFYCDKKVKRRSDYRAIAYQQFEHLILGVKQTYDKLQYLSRYYRESNLSKVPSFLLHGNSLLFEQPHTHNLSSTIDNVVDKTHQSREFSAYWQEISQLELRNWKNIMHIHTLRLILEHDQPKFKNIHCQNANGRFTHIQCRRAMSAISNFIRSYASFALLEDSLYIRFIHNKEDDLCDIETSATKGFVVIRIKKLLPIVVIYLMFTSGILDSHRAQIVDHIESELMKCKLRSARTSASQSSGSVTNQNGVNQASSILKSKVIYSSGESCCMLVRSPLERMLRVYSRSMIGEFLAQNLTHGLPGSCPLNSLPRTSAPFRTQQQKQTVTHHRNDDSNSHQKTRNSAIRDDQNEDCAMENNLAPTNRYNPVFGKYLYGIRVVHTIGNLPHELVHPMVQNVLVKISAILMNVRIKQGFHIAFNNSGLLTLVTELSMKDYSHEFHNSNCLCQYLVFPPTITNCCSHLGNIAPSNGTISKIGPSPNINIAGEHVKAPSKPGSICGSLGNSDPNFIRQRHELPGPNLKNGDNQGEIKVIREYWIEQQYGISTKSDNYHKSLENMRYPEVVDHLYITDMTIFDCLLTYDLLQLLCDKMSPFYELDTALSQSEPRSGILSSPTDSTASSNVVDQSSPSPFGLPSSLIEGTSKDGNSKIPLIELDYQFSIVKFVEYCQFASLDVVLFRDRSNFYEPVVEEEADCVNDIGSVESKVQTSDGSSQQKITSSVKKGARRLSVDVNNSETDQTRREHRSSYDSLNASSLAQSCVQPMFGYSLNQLFLETLHKRLKQIHDKELRLSECDKRQLTSYLKRRKMILELGDDTPTVDSADQSPSDYSPTAFNRVYRSETNLPGQQCETKSPDDNNVARNINWRCFMRKGNQENLMIVLIPDSLEDIRKWMVYIEHDTEDFSMETDGSRSQFELCPIFVFRCSSTMIHNQVLSFLGENESSCVSTDTDDSPQRGKSNLEADLSLHFGQPCKVLKKLKALNDELYNEILPLNKFSELSQGISDEKTQELVHFRAFLRKIKNTVLKSRFSSLNDAYLSELFVHKDDISYYINNVDSDIQKKYHVSSHLRGLAEFIKSYEDYHDSLPKEAAKKCNPLLNSILLQKCGLFINQPLARFDEANPLMKQLHDRKLLFLMRCNYKIELFILEENLAGSTFLKKFSTESFSSEQILQKQQKMSLHKQQQSASILSASNSSSDVASTTPSGHQASSLGRINNSGSRLMDMKCGSIGSAGVPPTSSSPAESTTLSSGGLGTVTNVQPVHDRPKHGSDYGSPSSVNINVTLSPSNDSFFLEAFKDSTCPIDEVIPNYLNNQTMADTSLRHEAHMAEVLKRKSQRKESHHYRRVLRSKSNYNQSHSAIDQALKKVDSLGRLEHFCLTPLLFSPAWRSKLAPVRDHTVGVSRYNGGESSVAPNDDQSEKNDQGDGNKSHYQIFASSNLSEQDELNERWHHMICNNYIKEYEQYIQTLGFNSVQIRFPSSSKLHSSMSSSSGFSSMSQQTSAKSMNTRKTSLQTSTSSRKSTRSRRESSTNSPSASFIPITTSSPLNATGNSASTRGKSGSNTNTGYLIKFLNSGCLVFKVGFCKPYVYSILYSIEGERFNNSNTKVNMTAFLDELDSIKVTLHLHSFTYDYHLRSMYSYISRRQINFNPGYHLISFADDFRKYYQKAPNYARNHILSGELSISGLKVDGQQLYNYIVTHNSIYQLEVLEMTNTTINNLASNIALSSTSSDAKNDVNESKAPTATQQFASFFSSQFRSAGNASNGGDKHTDDDNEPPKRNHANDYVLIELKREKVRYKDGKEPDIFDCGLIIAHDHEQTNASENCLALRYFLILTNQRELYPKLLHTDETVIGLGCHRPIRLGIVNQLAATVSANVSRSSMTTPKSTNETSDSNDTTMIERHSIPYGSSLTTTTAINMDEVQSASEFLSSSELSGPQSILSTVASTQSSNSAGLVSSSSRQQSLSRTIPDQESSVVSLGQRSQHESSLTQIKTEEAAEALVAEELLSASRRNNSRPESSQNSLEFTERLEQSSNASVTATNVGNESVSQSNDMSSTCSVDTPNDDTTANQQNPQQQLDDPQQGRTICDEEITYLGYFSSDEMDMLKFLQEKTASLKNHLEQIVHQAEVHFRRDYLWHKLMQRQSLADQSTSIMGTRSSSAIDQLPLTMEELIQLLSIVDAIDLAALDPSLATFATMHINWYMKLIKTFNELKQSQVGCLHRIYLVKASKILLLYIDPKCTTAFVLLSVNPERGSVEISMLLKNKQDCCSNNPIEIDQKSAPKDGDAGEGTSSSIIELDTDCQQLISDFINFCATFMWSNLLT
jgi:hypothetical protein